MLQRERQHHLGFQESQAGVVRLPQVQSKVGAGTAQVIQSGLLKNRAGYLP